MRKFLCDIAYDEAIGPFRRFSEKIDIEKEWKKYNEDTKNQMTETVYNEIVEENESG